MSAPGPSHGAGEVMELAYNILRGRPLDATNKQEIGCSHDATYQTLSSSIGRGRIQQRAAKHRRSTQHGSFWCGAGFSLHPTESAACFRKAIAEVLRFLQHAEPWCSGLVILRRMNFCSTGGGGSSSSSSSSSSTTTTSTTTPTSTTS